MGVKLNEIYVFLAIVLRKCNRKYLITVQGTTSLPLAEKIITRDRFRIILSMIHLKSGLFSTISWRFQEIRIYPVRVIA